MEPAGRIGAVLDRLAPRCPAATARARGAIATALAPLAASRWPEVAWRASALTDDGFPLEFAWTSRDPALRWTAEVAAPETPERDRLDAALALLERLGQPAAALPAVLPAGQPEGAALRFGCWIGGRHAEQAGDGYKVYAEIAEGRLPGPPPRWLDRIEAGLGKRVTWRMTGWQPDTGRLEFYGSAAGDPRAMLAALVEGVGLRCGDRAAAAAGRLTARPAAAPLRAPVGVSVAVERDGSVAGCGVFFSAKLAGRDPARIADKLQSFAPGCGTLALLAAPPGRFGLLGVNCGAAGDSWVQAGWRP